MATRTIKTTIYYGLFISLTSFCGFISTGNAQIFHEKKPNIERPVQKRLPEDLIAPGRYMGSFLIHPKITLEGHYDSNIFAQKSNTTSDYYTSIKPSITVLKEIRDHQFLLEANATIDRFIKEQNENNESYDISFKGKIIGNSRWQFPLSFFHRKQARKRENSLVTSTPKERLDTRYTKADIGVTRKFNRLSITLLGNYSSSTFEDGVTLDTMSPAIYSDNNRERYGGLLRFHYDLPRSAKGTDSEHTLFTNLTYGKNKYEKRDFQSNSFSGPLADNTEYGFLTGFITNYKGLLLANINAGVNHQSFKDSSLKNTNTAQVSAFLNYNILPKLTLNLSAKRENNQDNGLVRGILTSNYSVGADYELQHDLYLGTELGYAHYDFDDLGRKDDDYLASLYLKYNNSRNIESMLRLNYRDHQSNALDREFDRYEVIFSLTGKI
jgi:hypothetical protein